MFFISSLRNNETLEFIAEHHASTNAKANKLLVVGTKNSKVHEVAAFISLPFASLQVNKWYNLYMEEHVYKNNSMKKGKKESRQFFLLLSPSKNQVGVGVYIHKKTLSIVLTFM
ncbi:CAP domain-containing protein [Strongyloides ratti]|uniref:CAP domain-containing protein n=1 Tax=Strongyloides ratti TaxID=34506 RepID=A0A090L9Y9_STRRB|nr:CAP domain-containing protein [Strongyloides ratti]CEF66591.1 CAP domain-containing protein [Strongyloides ratti]